MNKQNRTGKRRKSYLRKADMAARYRTTPRNIELKVKAGVLAKPDLYLGRWPLWDEELQDERDRQAAMQRQPTGDQAA